MPCCLVCCRAELPYKTVSARWRPLSWKLKSRYRARNVFQEPSLELSTVAKLHRLAGRYDNPMSTWFLANLSCVQCVACSLCEYNSSPVGYGNSSVSEFHLYVILGNNNFLCLPTKAVLRIRDVYEADRYLASFLSNLLLASTSAGFVVTRTSE
jgi:hypothetical protein